MKNYITFYLIFLFTSSILGQDFVHPTTGTANFTAMGGSHNYYDSGGADCDGTGGEYSHDEIGVAIICPNVPGTPITIEFLEVDVEVRSTLPCWDFLRIYDGNSTGAPLLFEGCGEEGFATCAGNPGDGGDGGNIEAGPNDINASASGVPANFNNIWTSSDATGCLTVSFTTDGSVDEGGWVAVVTGGAVIPTMGQWGIIILSLILLVFGVFYIKNSSRTRSISS